MGWVTSEIAVSDLGDASLNERIRVDSLSRVRVEVVDADRTRELRRLVLRPSWPVGSPLGGDGEPGAVHLAALDPAGAVVGACVLYPRTYPRRPEAADAWQLRGMATAAGARSQGVGARVIGEAVTEVYSRGGRLLWCEAREPAIAFYARNGFHGDGETYIGAETGIVHQFMWRELSG